MKTDVIINRDALCALQELPSESVHCCVTSPPYYALRDYGLDAQIGQEDTPELLAEQGIRIARRTVAKYRTELRLGSAAARKRD